MFKSIILVVAGILIGFGFFYLASPQEDDNRVSMTADQEQLYTCGMHPEVLQKEPGNCPICGMKLIPVKNNTASSDQDKKILYWRAPMDPTEIYDRPGKSKMGMDLLPVYKENAGSGTGLISIDGRVQQNMNLRTTSVSTRAIARSLRVYGKVTVAEDYQYTVTTKIKGWIEKLYFNTTGQYVKKGQPLLEIYSPELVSTQEEFLLAHRNLKQLDAIEGVAAENARSLYESAKRRLELWDISQREINLLKETGQVKRTTVLRSPVNGYLMHKAVVEGDEVGKMPHLFLIADLSKVWVEATVYESELSFISEGQPANLNLDFINNEIFHGEVDFIYPYLDPESRAAKVRLTFNNPGLILKPDMHVTVNIISNLGENVLSIPQEAVIRTGVRNVVFVELEEGQFEPREVKLGATSDDGYVQILGGLFAGEEVVTSGQFLLDSESQTREAIQKMLAAETSELQQMKEMDEAPEAQKKNIMHGEMKCAAGKCASGMDKPGNTKAKTKPQKKEADMKCGEGKCGEGK